MGIHLKFDHIESLNKFKLVPKKKKTYSNTIKKLTKLVKGVCIKDGDTFKLIIEASLLKGESENTLNPDLLYLDFTEDSYNLKGVTSIFSRNVDKNGRYLRLIRDESTSKFFPGNPEIYVPFCNNWICSGYIVKVDNKLMFDFNECIAPKGYERFIGMN